MSKKRVKARKGKSKKRVAKAKADSPPAQEGMGCFLFCVVIIIIALGLLTRNEGWAAERYYSLQEGASLVILASADRVDPANEGKLVHLTGLATTNEMPLDAEFDLSPDALKLQRDVEMYQWEESTLRVKTRKGGRLTKTTYSYEEVWSSELINSRSFRHSFNHENPSLMLYQEQLYVPENITVGRFTLSPSLVEKIDNFETWPIDLSSLTLPAEIENKAKLINDQIYVGNDPQAPQIGDLRISFHIVKPTTLSLVAKQIGQTLNTYESQADGAVELVEIGTQNAESMFDRTQTEVTQLTRSWRLVGFVLMWIGFQFLIPQLTILSKVSPSQEHIGCLMIFFMAAGFSLLVISIVWLFYGSRLMIGLAVISLALIGGTFALTKRLQVENPVQEGSS